jgi:hypothetical protein
MIDLSKNKQNPVSKIHSFAPYIISPDSAIYLNDTSSHHRPECKTRETLISDAKVHAAALNSHPLGIDYHYLMAIFASTETAAVAIALIAARYFSVRT